MCSRRRSDCAALGLGISWMVTFGMVATLIGNFVADKNNRDRWRKIEPFSTFDTINCTISNQSHETLTRNRNCGWNCANIECFALSRDERRGAAKDLQ